MKAYSLDLREKVLRAVDQGYPRSEIVKLLGVSLATIKRYLKQRRETGDVAPKPIPGRPPKKLAPLQAALVRQLQAHDDVRLEDHCRLWEQAHGVRVSTATMSRAIKRLGWTRKKKRWQPANVANKSERTFANR
jgi:transposase